MIMMTTIISDNDTKYADRRTLTTTRRLLCRTQGVFFSKVLACRRGTLGVPKRISRPSLLLKVRAFRMAMMRSAGCKLVSE